jgi:hypothetical protein
MAATVVYVYGGLDGFGGGVVMVIHRAGIG